MLHRTWWRMQPTRRRYLAFSHVPSCKCVKTIVSGERVAVKTGRPSDLMTELVSFSYLSRVLYPFLFADFICWCPFTWGREIRLPTWCPSFSPLSSIPCADSEQVSNCCVCNLGWVRGRRKKNGEPTMWIQQTSLQIQLSRATRGSESQAERTRKSTWDESGRWRSR